MLRLSCSDKLQSPQHVLRHVFTGATNGGSVAGDKQV